jgi:hypothetical protein
MSEAKTMEEVKERLKTNGKDRVTSKEDCDKILRSRVGKVQKYPNGPVHVSQTLVDENGNITNGPGFISVRYTHNNLFDKNSPATYKKGQWHPPGCFHTHQGGFFFNLYDKASNKNTSYSDNPAESQLKCDNKWNQCIFK